MNCLILCVFYDFEDFFTNPFLKHMSVMIFYGIMAVLEVKYLHFFIFH